MVNSQLFIEFLRVYAFQPATAFWRAVEVDVLKRFMPTTGMALDLGCGDGKLTAILLESLPAQNMTIVGMDGDPDETQQAAQFPFYTRVHTCWASDVPELAQTFDHVFSNSVLEHIQDIEATIAEVARLLKPGGTFTFTVPAPGFHACLRGPFFSRVSREVYLQDMDRRLAHYRYWSVAEWQGLLKRYGLVIEQQAEYFHCGEVRRWETISRFTAGILYALSGRKQAPIEIQKKSGLRQLQNRWKLPHWLTWLLAHLLAVGVKKSSAAGNGCVLIQARRTGL